MDDLISKVNQRHSLAITFDGHNLVIPVPGGDPLHVFANVDETDPPEVLETSIADAVRIATALHFEGMLPENTMAQASGDLITWKMDDLAFQTEIVFRNHSELIQLITTVYPSKQNAPFKAASSDETTMVRDRSFTQLPGKVEIDQWTKNLGRDYILRQKLLAELRGLGIPYKFNNDGIVLDFGFTSSQSECVTEVSNGTLWYRCQGAVKQHDLEKKQKADNTLNRLATVVAPSPDADTRSDIISVPISTDLNLV